MNKFKKIRLLSLALMMATVVIATGSMSIAHASVIESSISQATADLVFSETVTSTATLTPVADLKAGDITEGFKVATGNATTNGTHVAWRWTPGTGVIGSNNIPQVNSIVVSGKKSSENKISLNMTGRTPSEIAVSSDGWSHWKSGV